MTTTGAPEARASHTAVWTGTNMIIWGGGNGGEVNLASGGRYNPNNNAWTTVTTTGAPEARALHTAVWTGTNMIIWGGLNSHIQSHLNTGGSYNPVSNSWTATTAYGAPDARFNHTAVWADSEMIVWGGVGAGNLRLGTGSRYNPSANSWTDLGSTGAPGAREGHTAVWTGSHMIIHGGTSDGTIWLGDTWSYAPDKKMLLYQRQ